MTLPIKIILALGVAAGAWLLARKLGASADPASPGSGAPSTGGSSLAENPSSNPFADLFKSLTGSGTPSTGAGTPSTGTAAPAKPGKKNQKFPVAVRPANRRPGVEGILSALTA